MKILSLVVIFFSYNIICQGQTVHKSTSKISSSHNANFKSYKKTQMHDTLDNRKIYMWQNGQKATPTGEQATGINTESFVTDKKDTIKVKKSKKG